MGEVAGVLLQGSWRSGPLGYHPPVVRYCRSCGLWRGDGDHRCRVPVYSGSALPMWWQGQLVPEGWDHARRMQQAQEEAEGAARWARFDREGYDGRDTLLYGPITGWRRAAIAGDELVRNGSAVRVVCVDQHGAEVLRG